MIRHSRQAMLELQLIDISAAETDPFECYRLHRAGLFYCPLELRQLLAGNIGQARSHLLVFRLPGPELFNIPAQRSLGPGVLRLVFHSFHRRGSGIGDLFGLGLDLLKLRIA